jgi:hypothetical protein
MLFKNPVRTSKRTPHFTITRINWLTLFMETVFVYSKNRVNPFLQNAELLDAKAGGTYSNHGSLKG